MITRKILLIACFVAITVVAVSVGFRLLSGYVTLEVALMVLLLAYLFGKRLGSNSVVAKLVKASDQTVVPGEGGKNPTLTVKVSVCLCKSGCALAVSDVGFCLLFAVWGRGFALDNRELVAANIPIALARQLEAQTFY